MIHFRAEYEAVEKDWREACDELAQAQDAFIVALFALGSDPASVPALARRAQVCADRDEKKARVKAIGQRLACYRRWEMTVNVIDKFAKAGRWADVGRNLRRQPTAVQDKLGKLWEGQAHPTLEVTA